MAQPLDPTYRAIGYSYTYSTYVFQVSQGIALHPPKFAPSQPRGGGGAEGIATQVSLWGHRAIHSADYGCPKRPVALQGSAWEGVSLSRGGVMGAIVWPAMLRLCGQPKCCDNGLQICDLGCLD